MSIEKKDNTPQGKSIKKLSKLGSRKPADAPKRVTEQIPDWLLHLLSKHGEAPGPLIGLEEPSFVHDSAQADHLIDEEAAQISALLEQMEEEGLPQDIDQRAATSVEWGRYDEDEHELPPGPIDDLLESLGRDEEDFFQETSAQDDDWLTGSVSSGLTSKTGQADPYSAQTAADQPDWLNDLIPGDESQPTLQTTFSDSEDSVPDWLNDALETPATFDAEDTGAADEFPTDANTDYEVPDWLTDALDQSAETPAAPTASPATGEVEVPDWLTDALDEPSAALEPSPHTDDTNDDIPDWLNQSTGQSITTEASKLPTVESPADDIPDWLEADEPPATPASAGELLADESDAGDWMVGLGDEPETESEIPDWLTDNNALSPPSSPEPKKADTNDIPDWLAADLEPESEADSAATQAAAFDWLSDLRDSVSDDDSPESDAFLSDADADDWLAVEPDDDSPDSFVASRLDWLAEIDQPASTEPSAEPTTGRSTLPDTDWLGDLESPEIKNEVESEPSLEATAPDDTDWLQDLEPPPDAELESETTTERTIPPGTGWLRELEPPPGSEAEAEAETSAERAIPPGTGWLRDLEPPPGSEAKAETSAERTIPPGTGWLRELEPPPGSEAQAPEPTSETAFETDDDDDWLATISEADASEAAPSWEEDDVEVEVDQPSDTIEPEELIGQASISDRDALNFLFSEEIDETAAELATASDEDSEEDIPAWLRAPSTEVDLDSETEMPAEWADDMPEDLGEDEEADMPDWLADLRPTAYPAVEVDDDELPDWLKESPDDQADTPDEEPAEMLIPDWLQEPSDESHDHVLYSDQEDEPEPLLAAADVSRVPDWLGSDPDEVPDWLSDDVSEAPDWLTESAAPEPTSPPTDAAEADLQTPDWLMNLPETPSTETTKAAAIDDQDLPSWLADLPEEGRSESEENFAAMSDWLSSLPAVEAISAEPIETSPETDEPLDEDEAFFKTFDLEEPKFEAGADDQEIPAWLTDSQPDDDDYAPPDASTAFSSVEEDMRIKTPPTPTEPPADDWLMGLRQVAEQATDSEGNAPDEDLETADWDMAPSVITSAAATETETDPDMPDWLARLRGTSTSPQPIAESANEIEDEDTSDWLTDQPAADTLEPAAEYSDEDEDLPDWLSDLPTAAEIETPEIDSEPNLPDWLADQPDTDAPEPVIEHSDEDEELPDWLADHSAVDTPEPVSDEDEDEDEDEDLPDWLAELPTAAEIETSAAEEPEQPSWLAELPTAAEIETPEIDSEPNLPDWLADHPTAETLEPMVEPSDQDEDLPDWLAELPTAAEIETPAAEEPDQPSWLSEFRTTAVIEIPKTDSEPDLPDWLADQPDTEPSDEDEDLPDWLTDQPTADTLEPAVEPSDEDEDLPDWLADQPAAETLEPIVEPSDEDEDLPNWLADLPTAAEIEPPGAEEPEQPDWLSGLPTAAKIEMPETDGEPDLPDWLADQPAAETLEPIVEPSDEDEDLPDWLADQPAAEPLEPMVEPSDEHEDLPDWLAELPTAAEIETPATEEPERPDWLFGLRTAAAIETPETDSEPDLPDWLADQPAAETPEPVSGPSDQDEELPDWLADQPDTDTLEPAAEPSDEDEDLPDWLADQPVAEPFDADEDLPDWLAELPTAAAIETPETDSEPDLPDWLVGQPAAETPEPVIEPADEDENLPDWLADQPAADSLEPAAELPDEDEDLPDWLSDLPTAAEIETPAAEEPERPDWLSGLRTTTAIETPETDSEFDLPPLQIPDSETFALAGERSDENEIEDEDDDVDLSLWFSDEPTPEASGISETDVHLEMPDWLADLVEIADTEPLRTETDETEAASWLDDLPEAGEDDDMPDWLTGLRSTVETETADADIEPDLTDWLADEAADSPVPEITQPAPDSPVDDDDLDLPDWLIDRPTPDNLQSEPSPLAADTSDDDLTMPDWLADLPELPEVEQAAQQRHTDAPGMPAWLSSPLYADADAEASEPVHSASTTLPQEQPAAADDDVPVWLAVLRETKGRDINPNELRYDYEASDQITPTVSDSQSDDSILIAASLATHTHPPADADTLSAPETLDADDDPEAPDWLRESADDTVEPEPSQSGSVTFDADADLDTPAWLTGLSDDDDAPAPDTDDDLAPLPWLVDQPASDADDTDLVAPAWLTDLSDDDDSPEPESGAASAMPAWLTDQPDSDDTDLDVPDWLADLSDDDDSTAAETDTDLAMPDWLADQPNDAAEAESPHLVAQSLDNAASMPHWLADEAYAETLEADEVETVQPEFDELDTETPETETVQAETDEVETAPSEPDELEATDEMAKDSGQDLVMPDWLFKGSLEELDTPEWLQDLPDIDQPAEETSADWMTELAELADEDEADAAAMAGAYTTASERLGLVVPPPEPAPPLPEKSEPPRETPLEEPAPLSGAPTESAGNLSGWLDALRTGEKTELEDDDHQIAETTGMLAGLGGLMPAETLFTPTTKGPADDLDLAAKKFYEIATQPPQPAALPAPLSHRAQFAGRAMRAILLLLFIGLIALPLIPGTQKVVNGTAVPWTEPTDNFSTVLDEQRRQLISEQLGIVDVQQPGSVALVSFDYSPATQGEMQPLAQAVLGRLAGQGMRIIAVSLEPEGAPIAQQTIETALADRNQGDLYGQDMINLGYLPGQVAAVRALAAGREFATLTDFTTGEPFSSQAQTDWSNIQTIEQVDLVVTLADNPTSARWWIEQMETAPHSDQRSLLAATSAVANPFLRPYRQSEQLDGLISGVEGAAAVESVRNNFGPARRMLDSQSLAHLVIIILIAIGTMVGWMPQDAPPPKKEENLKPDPSSSPEPPPVQHEPLLGDEDEPEAQE